MNVVFQEPMHPGPHLPLPMIEMVANRTRYGKSGITNTFVMEIENKKARLLSSQRSRAHAVCGEQGSHRVWGDPSYNTDFVIEKF